MDVAGATEVVGDGAAINQKQLPAAALFVDSAGRPSSFFRCLHSFRHAWPQVPRFVLLVQTCGYVS